MKILETGLVWDNPKPYLETRHSMHPTPVNLGNGELVCAHDIGSAPESLDYQTWLSRSLDNGKTWTLEQPINKEQITRPTSSMVRISNTRDGLVGLGARQYRDKHPGEGVLNRENLGYIEMDLIQVRSSDKGKTWTLPETVTPPLEGPSFEVSHAIVEQENGAYLAPMATWRGWDGSLPNGEKAIVLRSKDQGRSYPDYGVCFDGTDEGLTHWEQSVVCLDSDTVLSVAWIYHSASGTHRPNRYVLSLDGGRTFCPPREIGIQGQTCKVCHLGNGRLLLAYRRNDKPGLWAQAAQYDGTAIQLQEEMPLWGTGLAGSGMSGEKNYSDELSALKFGFPQMMMLDSQTVFLVFWAFEDWNCKIKYLRIQV